MMRTIGFLYSLTHTTHLTHIKCHTYISADIKPSPPYGAALMEFAEFERWLRHNLTNGVPYVI
jgi:hypothetical protein